MNHFSSNKSYLLLKTMDAIDESEIINELNMLTHEVCGRLTIELEQNTFHLMDETNHTNSFMTHFIEKGVEISLQLVEKTKKMDHWFRYICDRNSVPENIDATEKTIQSIQIEMIPKQTVEYLDDNLHVFRKRYLETTLKNHCKIVLHFCCLLTVNNKRMPVLKCISEHISQCFKVIQSVWMEIDEITNFITRKLCDQIVSLQKNNNSEEVILDWSTEQKEEEQKDEEITVSRININGVIYLLSKMDRILYDFNTHEPIGIWNSDKKTIEYQDE